MLLALCALLLTLQVAQPARAQAADDEAPLRPALFEWELDRKLLFLSISYRDVVDAKIREKLRRGLPTVIVLAATVFRASTHSPLSTTAQTCKVTWHVWEEAYRVEVSRPGESTVRWTTTVEGVLRRCAEARRLLAGDADQIPERVAVYARGRVQVNPISPEVIHKIQRWVQRPSSTGTAAPGDALFSTFTGFFMQRIGDAERDSPFQTLAALPRAFRARPRLR